MKSVLEAYDFMLGVLAQLPTIRRAYRRDIERDILMKYEAGWNHSEVVKWCKCREEVNPKLKEETALDRMRMILKSVQERKDANDP